MTRIEGCQLPCLPCVAQGTIFMERQSLVHRLKRWLAQPWNRTVKPFLKRLMKHKLPNPGERSAAREGAAGLSKTGERLQTGDYVLVRSREEIERLLDRWHETRGCAFLDEMWQYCGTIQRVKQPLERFLDERDYRVKKSRGIVLLEGVFCHGTPVFGRCDRSCHLFWREEWLERLTEYQC